MVVFLSWQPVTDGCVRLAQDGRNERSRTRWRAASVGMRWSHRGTDQRSQVRVEDSRCPSREPTACEKGKTAHRYPASPNRSTPAPLASQFALHILRAGVASPSDPSSLPHRHHPKAEAQGFEGCEDGRPAQAERRGPVRTLKRRRYRCLPHEAACNLPTQDQTCSRGCARQRTGDSAPKEVAQRTAAVTPNPSIERTRSGSAGLAFISFWAKPVLPPRAAHVNR